MKGAFDAAGVATPPWAVVGPGRRDAEGLFTTLGSPLIVKPAVAAGSMGITVKSVVHDGASLHEQRRLRHEGYPGWNLDTRRLPVPPFPARPHFPPLLLPRRPTPTS